jgi:2-dehydro-3-deoxyphosphogluconate aldolase/(4S)-4-hydroxy-2-oxoglutarate aldolase
MEAERIVVVVRGDSREHLDATVDTLVDAGLSCLEITFTLPGTADILGELAQRFGRDACVGAGTVLDREQAVTAVEAGARYLVSPVFDEQVQRYAASAGIPYIPGAMTPTEIARAWSAGAAAVKIFPAGVLGPRFLAAVREPLPQPALLPSGGIGPADIPSYLQAGARAVSLGGALLGDALRGGSQAELRSRVRQVRELLTSEAGR